LARLAASSNVYTPQVVANGRDAPDWHRWSQLPKPVPSAPSAITLQREGDTVTASIAPGGDSGQIAGYWAVLEDQHESKVRAGENAGETLKHDHVVRLYKPVPAWLPARAGGSRCRSRAVLPSFRVASPSWSPTPVAPAHSRP
jgi:hypothetical protein